MKIEIIHPFLRNCHDINALVKNVKTIPAFCNRLEQQSILFPDRYDPLKYKGDGFELFVEILLKLSPVDNRIGISNYQIQDGIDTGVDGVGIGIDGKVATVQVKYRSNNTQILTANADHLSNFVMSSLLQYKVNPDSRNNMLIITTANSLHYFTENEMFKNKVRCIGYETLRELVDNNIIFWDSFRTAIYDNLKIDE